ncbi:MAG: flagellar basal-body rod protein FlgF [Rhodospirillales bacterium]|nr:flagellar basal-body rod protein FlgF [Rhodospirillales bacterium]
METTSLISLSRQTGLRRQMEVVANNLANMNTVGFKGENMMFVDHFVRSRGGEKPFPQKLHFVRDIATFRNAIEGEITQTNNALDVAITGPGYFVVQTPDGERYTRNGRFQLDQSGQLVTQEGFAVLTQGGPIVLGPRDASVDIARDGTVASETGQLGKLRVVTFDNEAALRQVGNTLFRTDETPRAAEKPTVIQGALEASNVQPIVEITRMIDVQRTYESLARFIDREDERIRTLVREIGQLA